MADRIEKPDLAQLVAQRTDRDVATVNAIIDAWHEEVYQALKRGEGVTVRGFGSFYVRQEARSSVFRFNPGQRLRAAFGWSSTYRGPL